MNKPVAAVTACPSHETLLMQGAVTLQSVVTVNLKLTKETIMKRILVAISFALLAVPAFAVDNSTKTQGNPWANDYNFVAPAQ